MCRLAVTSALTVAALASASMAAPAIELLPRSSVILVQPVTVRLTGLAAGADVALTAETEDLAGHLWRSSARFRADQDGVVDLSRDAPVEGDWSGVDPNGPFWSMTAVGELSEESGAAKPPGNRSVVVWKAAVAGETVAEATLLRWHSNPALRTFEIRERGLVATFTSPSGAEGSLPGVIVLGGSGGGIDFQRRAGSLLASAGFATLALAYFDMPELPESLDRIPLEYFQNAIEWLQEHPVTNPETIGVIGVSKGGELALLLGSRFPQIKAVAAWVPGSVVFQSIAPDWPSSSSWSWQDKELPFVPYRPDERFSQSGQLVDLYRASLEHPEAVEAAAIPVERIGGPVLLFSGRDDTLWPATQMSEQVLERRRANGDQHSEEHIAYENAGHSIARLPYFPGVWATGNGGTPRGIAEAQIDSWRRLPKFLAEALAPRVEP